MPNHGAHKASLVRVGGQVSERLTIFSKFLSVLLFFLYAFQDAWHVHHAFFF
jgi:hypothetical protein